MKASTRLVTKSEMRLCMASLPGLLLSLETASYTHSGTADQNSPKLSNVNAAISCVMRHGNRDPYGLVSTDGFITFAYPSAIYASCQSHANARRGYPDPTTDAEFQGANGPHDAAGWSIITDIPGPGSRQISGAIAQCRAIPTDRRSQRDSSV